jgi:hypothetical protein
MASDSVGGEIEGRFAPPTAYDSALFSKRW